MIVHVAALSENRAIGIDGDLPWKISADLKHFKSLTVNKCIIMGRKTFESLPSALPKRTNVVITRDTNYQAPGAHVFTSIEQAIDFCQNESSDDIMIVGGAEIYKQTLDRAARLYLTIIHTNVKGDAFYPEFENQFTLVDKKDAEENGFHFSFCTFDRK
ncbi:MAG: dihydrofolate reductase [Bdellovibrionaceae bacterium]|nr:dihydrofolate reductase [Pseudobdellovibrionaceae bacterium]